MLFVLISLDERLIFVRGCGLGEMQHENKRKSK
jgi:hypothetical protein